MSIAFVKRVLVPVSNPKTAPELLRLGAHLIDPEDGKILALFINVTDKKPYPDALKNITQIIAGAQEEGLPIELIERTAISPERGILDASRELMADLIVLGFQSYPGTNVKNRLSGLIEEVAEAAPAHLLIYNSVPGSEIHKILVPVRGSVHSQVAMQQAVALANRYKVPLTALHVQGNYTLTYRAGMVEIDQAMDKLSLEERASIQRVIVSGRDIPREVEKHSDEHTLVVLGFSEGASPDTWLFGEVPQRIMAQTAGPVVLVRRAIGARSLLEHFSYWFRRYAPIMTMEERQEVNMSVQEMARFNTNYVMLIVLSAVLASFGLLQNSGAVIIGAMLVAPLMSPLMGLGIGMAQVNFPLLRRGSLTILQGVLLALVTSVMIGMIAPLKIPTFEMQIRGEPTVLDMGVALASGVVAAFALGRKDIPGAIAGVAIAAALMPPICTTGLALAFGDQDLFLGAGALVTLNLISISLGAYATFSWMGIRSAQHGAPWKRTVGALIVLVVLAVPLTITLLRAVEQSSNQRIIQDTLEKNFTDWDVVDFETEGSNPLIITVTTRGERHPSRAVMNAAEQELEARMNQDVQLEVVSLRLFVPPPEETEAAAEADPVSGDEAPPDASDGE